MKRRHLPHAFMALAAGTTGLLVGAVLSLTLQSRGVQPQPLETSSGVTAVLRPDARVRQSAGPLPSIRTSSVETTTYLAWTPGGLPPGFEARLLRLHGVRHAVVVASDVTWMTGTMSEDGQVIDRPRSPYAIPLEATAVDPGSFAAFLPQADRADIEAALAAGEGVLGESSAELRRLGPGGTLEFGNRSVRIAAVLPDQLVGASELLVSRKVGLRLGVEQDRYALIQPKPLPTAGRLSHALQPILPPGLPVQVRAPGDTPYPRQGDSVLPPVKIKLLFGEFAARPDPGDTGYLEIDPSWMREHIETRHLPLVGNIQCNVALFPQLRGALEDLASRGLGHLIRTEHGCFVPKFVLNDPHASLSHHSWGMAFDINLAGNEFGQPPHQDPRLVRILAKWGFMWGGRFVVPDGNHFEYRRPAASS
jgi:hypothetical protein